MRRLENREQRRRQLSDARRQKRGGKTRGYVPNAKVVPIGLASVRLGSWWRVIGVEKPFQIVAIDWSHDNPPVPHRVLILPQGAERSEAVSGPARALLGPNVEYVAAPGSLEDSAMLGEPTHAVDCDLGEDCSCDAGSTGEGD